MPSENSTFRFLQFSDVHLDSPQNRGVLSFTPAQRAARYIDLVESFISACRVASDQNVDAVLIPGGLWDHRSMRGDTAMTVLEAIAELKDIPVFITPGKEDPYTIDSYYNQAFLSARGLRAWPDNAFIFHKHEFSTFKHPTRSDVAITGSAHLSQNRVSARLLERYIPRDPAAFNILLFYGSLDSYPGMYPQPERLSAAFSVEELIAQSFSYSALGHYHEYTELSDNNDRVIGAYSGCLCGRNFDELGPRVAILGTLVRDEAGNMTTTLEPVEVASNRLTYLPVDVSGLDAASLKEEIAYAVQEHEIRSDVDIVCISLEGTHSPDFDPFEAAQELQREFYHLLIVDRTRPDYLSEEYDPRTTEYKFLESMLERQTQAEKKREADPRADTLNNVPGFFLSAKTIEDALYYGLDGMKRQKVSHRHVD